jgi:hypothetical protein
MSRYQIAKQCARFERRERRRRAALKPPAAARGAQTPRV